MVKKSSRYQGQMSEEQKRHARKKENNPFSEQEKHGDEAQRRVPDGPEEYQGNPSVQRRAPGIEDDHEDGKTA
jgi:hypothetical protein